jgi:hypothetical protein
MYGIVSRYAGKEKSHFPRQVRQYERIYRADRVPLMLKKKIVERIEEGFTVAEVGRVYQVMDSVVQKIIKTHEHNAQLWQEQKARKNVSKDKRGDNAA